MKKSRILLAALIALIPAAACKRQAATVSGTDILRNNLDKLTQVIIYDGFTPPVASRLYVYSSLASYEAIRFKSEGSASIAGKLRGFGHMPNPVQGKTYDFTLSASRAFFNVARHVKVFSVDSLKSYEQSVYESFRKKLDPDVYNLSYAFGDSVAGAIMKRANDDGYLKSRGKARYLGTNATGKWRPTPPDYLDGIEWCWNTMQTMVMDSAAQFRPSPPPQFSMDTSSVYYKNLKLVYTINKHLTKEQEEIARFWDDNPMVIEHSGHMMFANKKITPGGHWMGICGIAAKQSGADEVKTAKAFALTSIALWEAFISCWDEKYRSSFIRPVTAINESFDHMWLPLLQTPPFPEYTSGHSVISACSAVVLTSLFGNNFAFRDTSDIRYIGMQRQFKSFNDAALEVSVSRVYGGIHYMSTADTSTAQGIKLGNYIVSKLVTP
jgi:PAP2 superfamily